MKIIEYQAHPGETPFISACIDGRLDIAESLFAQGGVDLNARTDADTSVLEEMVFKTANRPVSFKITKLRGEDVSITERMKFAALSAPIQMMSSKPMRILLFSYLKRVPTPMLRTITVSPQFSPQQAKDLNGLYRCLPVTGQT